MDIVNIKNNKRYIREYIKLCSLEWGKDKDEKEMNKYISEKEEKIEKEDKVISVLGLIDNDILIGFISLFKHDDVDDCDLSPWYATIYVKKEYRGKGYSKILNDAILEEAKRLGYDRVYLKSELKGYYEKFGAKYLKTIHGDEDLFYIDLKQKV